MKSSGNGNGANSDAKKVRIAKLFTNSSLASITGRFHQIQS